MRDHHEATHMNSSEGEKVQFKGIVHLEGVVEGWLCDVEDMMRVTLKDVLRSCRIDLKKHLNKRDKWVKDWPGQMLITASQIQWTADCEKALDRGDKKGLKSIKKKQNQMLDKFTEAIRSNLTKMDRLKLVALCTIEVRTDVICHSVVLYMKLCSCFMCTICKGLLIASTVHCYVNGFRIPLFLLIPSGSCSRYHREAAQVWLQQPHSI